MRKRPTIAELRAALWALRAVRGSRRQLRRTGWQGLELPPVPELPRSAGRGVDVVLRRLPATCLERAFVLQRWRAAHGDPKDVIVGVRGTRADFSAHAWLDDEVAPNVDHDFRELVRLPP